MKANEYIALLRGINVGGNNIIKMAELRECITGLGFKNVRTYIQSGNILFETTEQDSQVLETHIQRQSPSNFRLI